MSRARALAVFLRVARLPTLPPPVVEPGFDEIADALLHGEHVERLDFLRWLGRARGVVFHGSPRDDLVELSTERTSRDSTEWGESAGGLRIERPGVVDLLRRAGPRQRPAGTRNGSIGVGERRFYFFVHNGGSQSPSRFGPGSLYILPSETFVAEQWIVDTAHLVSRVPVKPLARIDVTPEDFPFRDRIGYYRDREPIWISLLRA